MKRLEKKHPVAIRWFHWINFPVLFIMMWSGILIYWANDVYRVGIGKHTLFHFFPEAFYTKFNLGSRLAEGQAWHFVFAWIFALNGLAYVLYVAFSGEWKFLLPGRKTIGEAIQVVLHDLKIRKQALPRAKFNGAQRIAYTSVIFMGLGSLVTGLGIYKPVQLALISSPFNGIAGATGYEVLRFFHFWLTMGFCGFFLIHIAQVARAGWNNFRAMVTGHEVVTIEADGDHKGSADKGSNPVEPKPQAKPEPQAKPQPAPAPLGRPGVAASRAEMIRTPDNQERTTAPETS